jgi:16S rRNA (cytosine1402-N4)-methyltransferase
VHIPVLLDEALSALAVKPAGRYIDGTGGGGGHAEAVAEQLSAGGRLLVMDRDASAVAGLRRRLARFGDEVKVVHENYANLGEAMHAQQWDAVDGVLLDVGASSDQLDAPERGFSFSQDGPLDMRMDPMRGETAAELLNRLDLDALTGMLRTWGEEPAARRIARALVERRSIRPWSRTGELALLVERVKGGRRGKRHPATRTFQALRIAVNRELDHLETGLEAAVRAVRPGGRVVVISFHSLEDRLAKTVLGRHVGRWVSLQSGGRRWEGAEPAAHWVHRRPLRPSDAEIAGNPRARSAKLRAAERGDAA